MKCGLEWRVYLAFERYHTSIVKCCVFEHMVALNGIAGEARCFIDVKLPVHMHIISSSLDLFQILNFRPTLLMPERLYIRQT